MPRAPAIFEKKNEFFIKRADFTCEKQAFGRGGMV